MSTFAEFGLPEALQATLAAMHFTEPTPIQSETLPLTLAGQDVLATAQTGSGKTGAFSIPIVARMLQQPTGTALVLTPTRELATQVYTVINQLLGRNGIRSVLLIGGEPLGRQFRDLRYNPRIIVGTPGRINDHLDRGTLRLSETQFLVLDETDRMLDMGFGIQIDQILKHVPKERQTMMFSATLPPAIVNMSQKYLRNPGRVEIGRANAPVSTVKQEVLRVSRSEKYDTLLKELDKRVGSVIVFVRTKRSADDLAERLCAANHSADAIHGDLTQRRRDRAIRGFRAQHYRIMVATDIAARGLDIPHIAHVVNFDLPECPEDYIHRIGRTARAGAEGSALSFVLPEDGRKWSAIRRMLETGDLLEPQGVDRVHSRGFSGGVKPKKHAYGKRHSYGQRYR
jgi:superfamily II DNA/RNA helicase